jgi:hypothetical protein
MSEIKIERGVPLPEKRGLYNKYPFKQMKVGDSFIVPIDARIYAAASWAGTRNGMKFSTRKNGTCIRVWRVK